MKQLIFILIVLHFCFCKRECTKTIEGELNKDNYYVLKQVNFYNDCRDTTCYLHKAYYPNSTLSHMVKIVNNKFEGVYKSFDTLGKIIKEGFYLHGRKNGLWKFWNKNSYVEKEYVNDTLEGKTIEYFNNGTIVYGQYLKGKENGLWIWKKKDYVDQVARFENGKYNGLCFAFYPNGQMRVRSFYKNDTVGKKEYWDTVGVKITEKQYVKLCEHN